MLVLSTLVGVENEASFIRYLVLKNTPIVFQYIVLSNNWGAVQSFAARLNSINFEKISTPIFIALTRYLLQSEH